MKIPKNYTEAQIVEIFNRVVSRIAYKYRFGVHDLDDIKQEAMVYAIQAMDKYDEKRPLENFLYIHLKNRLYNFKRNNYFRLAKPCERCPIKAFLPPDGCSAYTNREDCELFRGWLERNTIRKNLTNVLEYGQISSGEKNLGYSDQPISKINSKEVLALIDKHLSIGLRKDFLKVLAGEKIPKKDRTILEEAIIALLKKYGYEL